MTDLESVYMSTWLEARTVTKAAIITINSVLVDEIQFISTAAWNWDRSTVKISVYVMPALILRVPIFWTKLSV